MAMTLSVTYLYLEMRSVRPSGYYYCSRTKSTSTDGCLERSDSQMTYFQFLTRNRVFPVHGLFTRHLSCDISQQKERLQNGSQCEDKRSIKGAMSRQLGDGALHIVAKEKWSVPAAQR
jgi:hypothetical protein